MTGHDRADLQTTKTVLRVPINPFFLIFINLFDVRQSYIKLRQEIGNNLLSNSVLFLLTHDPSLVASQITWLSGGSDEDFFLGFAGYRCLPGRMRRHNEFGYQNTP